MRRVCEECAIVKDEGQVEVGGGFKRVKKHTWMPGSTDYGTHYIILYYDMNCVWVKLNYISFGCCVACVGL